MSINNINSNSVNDSREKDTRRSKIQKLFITELFRQGQVELTLPTGLTLEVGVTHENQEGDLEICDDYCWVIASQEKRTVSIDPYTFGLRFSEKSNCMIYEQDIIDYKGEQTKVFDVI